MPMRNKSASWHQAGHTKGLLLTGLMAAGMMTLLYFLLGLWPFGDGSILTGDLGGLYINFYAHLKRAVLGQAGFFYGFDKGLGGSLVGLFAYYYASPLNLLYVLFPVEWFPVAASFLLLVKVVLACVFFYFFIAHKESLLPWQAAVLSLCYGFMAYAFVYAQNPMWQDVLLLLPLVCHGIENIAAGKSFLFYILALGLAIYSDFYIAYMVCLFALLYFLWVMALRADVARPRDWLAPSARFAASSLIAAGLSAWLLVPALANINQNKGGLLDYQFSLEPYFPINRMAERLLWGSFASTDVSEHIPFLYCGMVVLFLVACYFVSRAIPLKEKLLSGGILVLFVLSFWIRGLDYLWHGFKEPIWFPARYSFIFCFFLLVLAARTLSRKAMGRREALWAGGGLGLALLVMLLFPIAISRSRILLSAFALASLSILFFAAQLFRDKKKVAALCSWALLGAVALELSLNGFFITRQLEPYTFSDFRHFAQSGLSTIQEVKKQDDGDFRMGETFFRTLNDPMLLGYWGMSHFASTQDGYAQSLLYNLGFRNYDAAGPYLNGGTAFADSVLGIGYLMDNGALPTPLHWQAMDLATPMQVHQNPYRMPLAFAVPPSAPSPASEAQQADLFAFQNQFYQNLGGTQTLFAPAQVVCQNGQGQPQPVTGTLAPGSSYHITADQAGPYYAWVASDRYLLLTTLIDGQPGPLYFSPSHAGVISLGYLQAGQTVTLRWDQTADIQITQAYFAGLNMAALEDLHHQAQQNSGNFALGDGKLEGRITREEAGLLYTSIPWDEDWQATINGQKAEPQPFMGGLLALPLPAGDSQVEIRFVPGGLQAGVALSLVSLLGLVGWTVMERKKRAR